MNLDANKSFDIFMSNLFIETLFIAFFLYF